MCRLAEVLREHSPGTRRKRTFWTLSRCSNILLGNMLLLPDNTLCRRVTTSRTYVSFVFPDQAAQSFPQCDRTFTVLPPTILHGVWLQASVPDARVLPVVILRLERLQSRTELPIGVWVQETLRRQKTKREKLRCPHVVAADCVPKFKLYLS